MTKLRAFECLNSKQGQAVVLLASGNRCKDVAEALKVTPETISNWKRLPAFKAAVNSTRLDIYESAMDNLWTASHEAVAILRQLMQKSSPRVKLDAATTILKLCKVDDRAQAMSHIGEEDTF